MTTKEQMMYRAQLNGDTAMRRIFCGCFYEGISLDTYTLVEEQQLGAPTISTCTSGFGNATSLPNGPWIIQFPIQLLDNSSGDDCLKFRTAIYAYQSLVDLDYKKYPNISTFASTSVASNLDLFQSVAQPKDPEGIENPVNGYVKLTFSNFRRNKRLLEEIP